MGTTAYFDQDVRDSADEKVHSLEIGTTGYGGNGPQVYLNLDSSSVLLSHDDAKKFFAAVERIAGYFGYDREG